MLASIDVDFGGRFFVAPQDAALGRRAFVYVEIRQDEPDRKVVSR